MGRFVDFDAAWAAQTGTVEPPTLRVLGQDITLPDELPASVMLLYSRAREDDRVRTRSAVLDDVIEVLVPLIGQDVVDRCLDAGWGFERLHALSFAAIAAYRPDDEQEEENEGEDEPPATGASSPTSSKGGRSSKRTSGASTASSSRPKSQRAPRGARSAP